MKLSEFKALIRQVLKEDYAYHQVQNIPIADDLYELQLEKRDKSSWETIKSLPTYEQAKTEMLKISADSQSKPSHYRIVGSRSKKIFDSKEVLQ